MPDFFKLNTSLNFRSVMLILLVLLVSCGKPFVRKAPKGKFYFYKNNIEVKGGNFTKDEKKNLLQRLKGQLDDSAKVKIKTSVLIINTIKRPIAFDTVYTSRSAANMRASMFHIGYYNANVSYTTDTAGKKITVNYLVESGKPTLIDTVRYLLRNPDLQNLALQYKPSSFLVKGNPISKTSVLSEVGRLVDSFRNNGYYKFTAAELKVRGDTTIAALTTVTDDPFEQLRLLAEAEQKRDSPEIKLAIVLNPPNDSTRLNKYYINKIYILPDYQQGDSLHINNGITEQITNSFIIRYHTNLFKTKLFARNIPLRPGQLFRQNNFYKAMNNLSATGLWQSVNILVQELADSSNKVNLIVELIPAKKYGFEAALEMSYSASTNTSSILAGNLFGLSGNLSLLNRNLGKEGIRMSHSIRAGVELNSNNRGSRSQLINSNEVSYSNTTLFPKLVLPGVPNFLTSIFRWDKNKNQNVNRRRSNSGETFINLGLAYNTRLNLFNLQSVNASFGWAGVTNKGWKWTISPISVGFSYLFNQSDSFRNILKENPFLQYSYNTAYVPGISVGAIRNFTLNPKTSLTREASVRWNVEESDIPWGYIPILQKYKRRFIKPEIELKYATKKRKTTFAGRFFLGVGVPLLGSDTNRTLPFFKQYFGGGSNSMRAWPVRGIGPGGRGLIPYSSNQTIFNDRTGDMQLEVNLEYRHDIAAIIPNTLTLRGALFADIGNVWNLRNTKLDGGVDTAQFKFKNLWSQTGIGAGYGLRLDFNYFVLRLDLGFRFKRPELFYKNDGWKAPPIGFDDVWQKLFLKGENDQYRKWRYENFNFTIGIGYWF